MARQGQIMLGFGFDFTLNSILGNSLVVLWLGLWVFTVVDMGSIPGQGTQISHAVWPKSKYFKNKLIQVKMENKIRKWI